MLVYFKVFLKFRKFEPRYSYKIYFYRKNKCINYRINRRTGGYYLTTTKQTRFWLFLLHAMFFYFRKNPVIAIMDVLSSSFFSRRFQQIWTETSPNYSN